jgi:catechol 2,3-dioxygenase-like lactoylglutathione lyase family enzyme
MVWIDLSCLTEKEMRVRMTEKPVVSCLRLLWLVISFSQCHAFITAPIVKSTILSRGKFSYRDNGLREMDRTSALMNSLTGAIVAHHSAVKTRDIEVAIKFYSLLGFRVEAKFRAGPARAAFLTNVPLADKENEGRVGAPTQTRIELLEVPAYMLQEAEGTRKRAIDLAKHETLLGLNHLALDVTECIRQRRIEEDMVVPPEEVSGAQCSLYGLQSWIDDLNSMSIATFGKNLRIAVSPDKQIIGSTVYEYAFLYDADGSLIELVSAHRERDTVVDSGWEPWDGSGFMQ